LLSKVAKSGCFPNISNDFSGIVSEMLGAAKSGHLIISGHHLVTFIYKFL